jgi:hypothetical protein
VGTGTSVATSERASSSVPGGAGAGPRGLAGTTRGARTGSLAGSTPCSRSERSWSMTRSPAKASRQ